MGFYTLNNDLSAFPNNPNEGFNNSWLEVDNNANRLLYAQASYVTNFDDLQIILNTADVRIGAVEISDATNNNLRANVVSTPAGGALRVLTQDLEAEHDDVSLGDLRGNPVAVNAPLSALNVFVSNLTGDFATQPKQDIQISLLQTLTSLEIESATSANQLSGITLLKSLTAYQELIIGRLKALSSTNSGYATSNNQTTMIGLLRALSSTNAGYATSTLQLSSNTLLANLTAKDYATAANQTTMIGWLKALSSTNAGYATSTLQLSSNTLLANLTAKDYASSAYQLSGITLLNSLTAYQEQIIGRLKALSSTNSGYATSANQTTMIGWLKALSSTNVGYSTSALQVTHSTLLSSLTAKDYSSSANQQIEITLLRNLTGIDYATSANQEEQLTLLSNLSSLQVLVSNPISSVEILSQPNNIITDPEGHIASINSMSSALQVYITNSLPISITQAINTVVASHSITNVGNANGFHITHTPYVCLVVSAVPYSTATLNLTDFILTNFDHNAHALYYKWIKNPTLSITPTWLYNNNLRYSVFNDANSHQTQCQASGGDLLHGGILASFQTPFVESIKKFPITGDATPDVYALVVQTIQPSQSYDVWYTLNFTETLVQQLPNNNIINIIMDGGFF